MARYVDSPSFRFIGANIKGTPAMPAEAVREDLRTLKARTDVLVIQEFKWPWYWRVLGLVLRYASEGGWRGYPSQAKGAVRPVRSAQAIYWRRRLWRRLDSKQRLLHDGVAGISDDRMIRGALLRHRGVKARVAVLAAWMVTWHNVVGGDGKHDGPKRRAMLDHDLDVAERFLTDLVATGHPIIGEVDANIHRGTAAYDRWVRIVQDLGGTFHGAMGVEYLFTIPGRDGTTVVVEDDWVVPTSALRTDHEARGITAHLRGRAA